MRQPSQPFLELRDKRQAVVVTALQPFVGGKLTSRSMLHTASMRLTASSATGEIAAAFFPRLALVAMSASTKNLRREWAQQSYSDQVRVPGVSGDDERQGPKRRLGKRRRFVSTINA